MIKASGREKLSQRDSVREKPTANFAPDREGQSLPCPPGRTAEVLAAAIRQGREKGTSAGAEVKPSLFTNDATLYGKSQRPQQKAKQLHELAGHKINTNISYAAVHQQRTI